MSVAAPSVPQARACLVLAAVLWSLGSFFMRFLREPSSLATSLHLELHEPQLTSLQIACYRGLTVSGGSKGVGDAVNQAVVLTVAVLVPVSLSISIVQFALL